MVYLTYPFLILHSLVGWAWTAGSLTVMSGIAYLTRPEGKDAQLRHYHRWAQGWGRTVAAACRVRIEVEGRDHLEAAFRQRAVVIACNHQSMMDIPILLASVPGYFAFVSKAEVFAVPVLGPYMEACGFVKLRRGDQAGSREAMSECVEALQSGRSVLMFPEGTRSDTGALLPFKRGAAVLAARAQVPILPVALDGSFSALAKGTLLARPASVTLRAGPLLMPPPHAEAVKPDAGRRDSRDQASVGAGRSPASIPRSPASGHPVLETTARLRQAVGRLLPARPATTAVPGDAKETPGVTAAPV